MKKCNIKGNRALTSSCHPRVFLSGISPLLKRQSGGDSQLQHLGMTALCNNRAFTLIELLVVVLIIGILAAVALPQYRKAVEKAHLTEALAYIADMEKAVNLYVLENQLTGGQIEIDSDALDLSFHCDTKEPLCWRDNFGYFEAVYTPSESTYEIYAYRCSKESCLEDGNIEYVLELSARIGKSRGKICYSVTSLGRDICNGLSNEQGWKNKIL